MHQVVSPSGYFSDMSAIAQMARCGRVYLLRPQGRLNPIHGADVAAYCLDKVESAQEGSYDIGGPEVLSWREVAQYAFEAVGRPVKITVIPPRFSRRCDGGDRPYQTARGRYFIVYAVGLNA